MVVAVGVLVFSSASRKMYYMHQCYAYVFEFPVDPEIHIFPMYQGCVQHRGVIDLGNYALPVRLRCVPPASCQDTSRQDAVPAAYRNVSAVWLSELTIAY